MRKLLYIVSLLLVVVACQKEIELDYRDIEPVVSIEGRVTNEQVYVLITRTRSMNDSVKGRGIGGARGRRPYKCATPGNKYSFPAFAEG